MRSVASSGPSGCGEVTTVAADLHIHSVLSPCGDLAMSPLTIVQTARQAGLDVVAIADHNCARNAPALAAAASRVGMKALYGVEVRSSEEVDLLVFFDGPEPAVAYGEWVYERLPEVLCESDVFGDQVVVDVDEEILGFAERLLIGGIAATLDEAAEEARARGGLVIPAHVDRPVDSVISQLGWLPADLVVDAVEVSRYSDEAVLAGEHPWLRGLPVVRFSDAHRPQEIGYQRTRFHVAEVTVDEFRAALAGRDGRWAEPVRPAPTNGQRPGPLA